MRLEDQPIPSHPTPPKNWLYALRSKGYSGVACARFAPLDVSGLGRVQHHHHHRPARGPARIVVGRASVPKTTELTAEAQVCEHPDYRTITLGCGRKPRVIRGF